MQHAPSQADLSTVLKRHEDILDAQFREATDNVGNLSPIWFGRGPRFGEAGFTDSFSWKARNHADGRLRQRRCEGNGTDSRR
jgi:hypothetical protein